MSADLGPVWCGPGRCRFRVWAPAARRVELRLLSPEPRAAVLERGERGYHETTIDAASPGALYRYRLDDGPERPDPASRFQPDGVHGPSRVPDPAPFVWHDSGWRGAPLENYVLYEIHAGTFTPEGTFDAIIPHLDDLRDLGVTAVELMPVAQFPGARNWGYDGVQPFAVQNTYGGPDGLQRLVDACHRRGLAAVLDVVYNHLGPEGNYLQEFGPYFSDRYRTPWGPAINFDGPHSDEVRHFFIENALYWITEFHIDALRLDAIHGIVDLSARPFLAELADAVRDRARDLGRAVHVIAESDLNDVRVVRPPSQGGYGHDAQWNDDFHHALHTLLTGERQGYYQDFGRPAHLAKALREGFVLSGEYSPFRRRRHGTSSVDVGAHRLVVFAQNHDQVGNRMLGDRLGRLVSFEALKLAAGAVLLSPCVPLLFMGEEYGETAPFQYFVSHSDPALVEAVRSGRRREFAEFRWEGDLPDPQDEATFLRSKLDHGLRRQPRHATLRALYAELLRLRRELPALARPDKESLEVTELPGTEVIVMRRGGADGILALFNFSRGPADIPPPAAGRLWRKRLDSSETRWDGPGSAVPDVLGAAGSTAVQLNPHSFALFG